MECNLSKNKHKEMFNVLINGPKSWMYNYYYNDNRKWNILMSYLKKMFDIKPAF